jgi:prophage DNA circulation protein
LQFDDVERSGGKKAAVHEFPQQNTASVQDLGNASEKIPMAAYFTGADYDTEADAFWNALSEKGAGSLQHPRWGNLRVLPLSWSQTEKWVDGLGRADFRIDFIRVQEASVFPITSVSAAESVGAKITGSISQSQAEAAALFDPENAADIVAIKEDTKSFLDKYNESFAKVTAVSEEIQAEANRIVRDITSNIDAYIEAPLQLFNSLSNLAALPAKVVTNVVNKIDAYKAQIEAAFLRVPESYSQAINTVQALFYTFAGASNATTSGEVRTRNEAAAAADTLGEITARVAQIVESCESAVPEFRASPETLAALTDAAATARAALIESAFTLRSERRVTLATDRTPLDLLAEFYGDGIEDIDAALDEFITTNQLSGDAIVLIPAGQEVVYYG